MTTAGAVSIVFSILTLITCLVFRDPTSILYHAPLACWLISLVAFVWDSSTHNSAKEPTVNASKSTEAGNDPPLAV